MRDPQPDRPTADAGTVAELSVINQAIGVLIDRGAHPDDAPTTLTCQATATGMTLTTAATHFLASTAP